MTGSLYYVYLIRSIPRPDQTYVGFTENLAGGDLPVLCRRTAYGCTV
jgi:hypothetical protein